MGELRCGSGSLRRLHSAARPGVIDCVSRNRNLHNQNNLKNGENQPRPGMNQFSIVRAMARAHQQITEGPKQNNE